jgi:hypothetical protein
VDVASAAAGARASTPAAAFCGDAGSRSGVAHRFIHFVFLLWSVSVGHLQQKMAGCMTHPARMPAFSVQQCSQRFSFFTIKHKSRQIT